MRVVELAQGMAHLLAAREDLTGFAVAFRQRAQREPVNTTKALRIINGMLGEAADAADAADATASADFSGVTQQQGQRVGVPVPGGASIGSGARLAGGAAAKYGSRAWSWLKSGAGKAANWVRRALLPASGAAGAGSGAVNLLKKGLAWLLLITGALAAIPPLVKQLVRPALSALLGAAWPFLAVGAAWFFLGRKRRRS